MAFCEDIEQLLIAEAQKELPPLVTHVKNYPNFLQQDVEDTAKTLIANKSIRASFHFHYKDLCTITFLANRNF